MRALRKSDGPIAYKLQINAQEAKLVKPIELKLRFDIDQMEQNIQKKYTLVPGMEGFQKALKREVQWLSFYKWRSDLKLCERLNSGIDYNPNYDPSQKPLNLPQENEQDPKNKEVAKRDVNFQPSKVEAFPPKVRTY